VLYWVVDLGFDITHFSLDSKIVVIAFNGDNNNNEFDNIIRHCRQLFNNLFKNSTVELNRRQANEVAHELGRAAALEANSQLFINVHLVLTTYYPMK